MNPQPIEAPSFVIKPGSGRVFRAFGEEITVHLGAEQTGGSFSLFTDVTPPGGGPPPHYHVNEDETFYVLEGRAEFFRDGAWTEVPVGTVVHIPKGVIHTFRNPSDRPLRQLVRTSPSGFEDFIAEAELEFSRAGGPRMELLPAIAAKHGIQFLNG